MHLTKQLEIMNPQKKTVDDLHKMQTVYGFMGTGVFMLFIYAKEAKLLILVANEPLFHKEISGHLSRLLLKLIYSVV